MLNQKPPSNHRRPCFRPAARQALFAAALIGLSLLAAGSSTAATWTGYSGTSWNDSGNWDTGVPGNGDAVVVPDVGNDPTMPAGTYPSSGAYLSFEVQSGAIVTCLGDTNAINAPSGGSAGTPHGTGVAINCQSAVIEGTLSANLKGFDSALGYGGPGCAIALYGCGGTYGGQGGYYLTPYYSSMNACGALTQPTALGSAGYNTGSGWAGQGGGAIQLNVTGTLTLNGTITACGNVSTPGNSPGGSGGSIWLRCASLHGNGIIQANGGTGFSGANNKSSGGGGRVTLEYTSSTFSGAVSVAGGGGITPGQPGTLYDPGKFATAAANIVITNSYQYFFPGTAANYSWGLTLTNGAVVYFHDFTNGTLTFTNLLVANGSTLRFDVDSNSAFRKTGINNLAVSNAVTVAGNSALYLADCRGSFTSLVVSGNSRVDFSICTNAFEWLSNVAVTEAGSYLNFGPRMRLPSLSSIFMSTNTTLFLPAQTYTLTNDLNILTGAVLYVQGDTNAANEASGGTAEAPHGSGATINCQNALINGTINADFYGFNSALGYGGPGCAIALYGCGGTYGGRGGYYLTPYYSSMNAYGALTQPTALGSAGYNTITGWAGQGGGAIRLNVVNNLNLNGTVTARGKPPNGMNSSGGSGGSIWLACKTFQGNGNINAGGGHSSSANKGGGGGGRVAVEYHSSTFSGTVSVAGGTANNLGQGLTGTVFLCQSPWTGTATTNGPNGRQLDTRFSVSSNNVQIARAITRFDTSVAWSDVSTDTSGSLIVTNVAVYTIRGLNPNHGYVVYMDGAPQFGGKLIADAGGALTFTNTLDMQHDFLVTTAEPGTMISFY